MPQGLSREEKRRFILEAGKARHTLGNFGKQFAVEFGNYPENQQDKISDFTDVYEKYGLNDFSKYQGKISQS